MISLLKNLQKWLLICVFFAVPLFFFTTTTEFYVTHKFYLLTFTTLTIILLASVELIFKKKVTLVPAPFGKTLIIILISYGLSVLFSSSNKIQALMILPNGLVPLFVLILLYFVLVLRLHSRRDAKRYMTALSTGSVVAAIFVIIFSLNILGNVALPRELSFLKNQTFSPIGSQLDTMVFFGFFLFIEISSFFKGSKNVVNKTRNIIFSIILLVAVTFVIYSYVFPKNVDGNVSQGNQLPPFSVSWFAAVESLKDVKTAVVGFGVDNYAGVFPLVKPASYNQTDVWQLNFNLSRSHILHIWTETGLLGLIAWLLLIVYTVREIHGLYIKGGASWIMFALAGLYLCVPLTIFPTSFTTLFLLMIFLAVLTSISAKYNQDEKQSFDLSRIPFVYLTMSLLLVLFAGGSAYLAGRAYAGEYYYKKSFDAAERNDGKAVYDFLINSIKMNPKREVVINRFSQINLLLANNTAQKKEITDQDRQRITMFIQQAISSAKGLINLNPTKPYHWTNLAVIYRNIINVAEGSEAWTIAAYRRAIQLDPNNPQLVLNLGGVYYSIEDYPSAIAAFEQSVALKPDWANARYNLAWALYKNNQPEEAAYVIKTVLPLIKKDSEDYKVASQNLKEFEENIPKAVESTQEGQLKLPEKTTPVLSPPVELPEGTGPEEELKDQPKLKSPTLTPTEVSVTPGESEISE